MQSPVDIKAVLDAMTDTEEARTKPVRVHIYLDDTASEDCRNLIIASFKTTADNATVLFDSYPADGRMPDAAADMAVLVAGENPDTGMIAADLRSLSTPSVVVTMMPDAVMQIAADSKYSLLPDDVISPLALEGGEGALLPAEPFTLTVDRAQAMREALGSWIVEVFPDKRLAFANAFGFVRHPLSLEAVRSTSVQNAGIGLVVILPGADMPLMTLNQLKMLLQIAAAYGESLTMARLKEIVAVVAGAFGCRFVARSLVSAFPGVGWAIKAGIGYGGTAAIGHALIEYFEADGDMSRLARKAVEAGQEVAPALGISADAPLQDNVQHAVSAVCDNAAHAVASSSGKVAPFVKSIVAAAGEATGLTPQDVGKMARGVTDAVGSVVGQAR